MKSLYLLIFLFAFEGCGSNNNDANQPLSGNCSGTEEGTWDGLIISDSITFGSDCSFKYTGEDGCHSEGTFDRPLKDKGSTTVEITKSEGGTCLMKGIYTCAYKIDSQILTFNCGYGNASYRKE